MSTERFRYIEYADTRKPAELYDLQADQREWNNVAANADYAETLAKLKTLATEHRQKY